MIALVTLIGYVVGYALALAACCCVVEGARALWRRRQRLRGLIDALKQRQRGWLLWRR